MDDRTTLPGQLLDEIAALVGSARSLPMSASCVVNRDELLGLVDRVRAVLPDALGQAREVLGDRAAVVDDGRREAERIVELARADRLRMLAETDVLAEATAEADRVLHEAGVAASALRAEVEDYVDGKLATFEIVLTRTLAAVDRGRAKLAGRHELDELARGPMDLDEPPLP